MNYHRNFILGGPIREADKKAFKESILKRFDGNAREAQAFMINEADRQMTKANGLLGCASILAALSFFVNAKEPLVLLIIALLLLVTNFYSKWSVRTEPLTNLELDFDLTYHICINRSIFNNVSAFLLFISIIWLVPYLVFLKKETALRLHYL